MQIQFSKMHGLGNDFVVIDNVTQNVFFSKEKIQQLSNRNFGIGFDQLLMVEHLTILTKIFITEYLTQMALRYLSAVTAHVVLLVL